MKSRFVLLFLLLAMAACNNQPGGHPVTDDTATAIHAQKDSAPQATPVTTTSTDLQDDSVFADGSKPSSWSNAGIDHPVAFKQFVMRLQGWVANGQKDSVAAAIAFPLQHPPIKNSAAFLKNYDTYINEKVKTALLQQNLRQIFRNGQGAMMGDGQLWMKETATGFAIISINN